MIYDIYHDECKEGGYWHGFLFVPRENRKALLSLMQRAREIAGYSGRLHYQDIRSKAKPNHQTYSVAQAWTSIGCNALQQRKLRLDPPRVTLGVNPSRGAKPTMEVLDYLLRCKFVLLRERDKHEKMFPSMDGLARIHTTFRMAIKGGVHRLFNEQEPIQIGNVFIDGEEQYIGLYGRRFDIEPTLERLAREMRGYVSCVDRPKLVPQRNDHELIEDGQNPEDSHLLQLCDLLIGGFRFHVCVGDRRNARFKISAHCRSLLERDQDNPVRMRNSRYHNGFSLRETWIDKDEWRFGALTLASLRRGQPEQNRLDFEIDSASE
jgi:hypothetical protein